MIVGAGTVNNCYSLQISGGINSGLPMSANKGSSGSATFQDATGELSSVITIKSIKYKYLYDVLQAYVLANNADTKDLKPWSLDEELINQGYPILGGSYDVVYLRTRPADYVGNYTGNSYTNSVSTLSLAYDRVKENGTIVVCGPFKQDAPLAGQAVKTTITSVITENGKIVDYRNTKNAVFSVNKDITLNACTTFKDIKFNLEDNYGIYASGNPIIMSTGLQMTGQKLSIYGGAIKSPVDNTTIIIESGTYYNIIGGGSYDEILSTPAVVNDTSITITGGTITNSVYGAGYYSSVGGNTYIYIGENANPSFPHLVKSDIYIGNSVIGGSLYPEDIPENAIDSSVKCRINIDGTGYRSRLDSNSSLPELTILSNIIGFNLGTTSHGSNCFTYINNYGTSLFPMINTSIQRANTLEITNSYIKLTGKADVSNLLSTTLYSLNRIGSYNDAGSYNDEGLIMKQSTLECDAPFNMVMHIQSKDLDDNIYNDPTASTITTNTIYMRSNTGLELSIVDNVLTGAFTEYGKVDGIFILDVLNGTSNKTLYAIAKSDVYQSGEGRQSTYTYSNFYYVDLENSNTLTPYSNLHYPLVVNAHSMYDFWEMGQNNFSLYEFNLLTYGTNDSNTNSYAITIPSNNENTIWNIDKITISNGLNIVSAGNIINANTDFVLKVSTGNGWLNNINFGILGNSSSPSHTLQTDSLITEGGNAILTFSIEFIHDLITQTGAAGIVFVRLINNNGDIIDCEITILLSDLSPSAPSSVTLRTSYGRSFEYITAGYASISILANQSFSLQLIYTYVATSKTRHYIEFNDSLPAGTRISLIDMSEETQKFYYYIVGNQPLSAVYVTDFKKMGEDSLYFTEETSGTFTKTVVLHFDFSRCDNYNHANTSGNLYNFYVGPDDIANGYDIHDCSCGMITASYLPINNNTGSITITQPTDANVSMTEAEITEDQTVTIGYQAQVTTDQTDAKTILSFSLYQNGYIYEIENYHDFVVTNGINSIPYYVRGNTVYVNLGTTRIINNGNISITGFKTSTFPYNIKFNLYVIPANIDNEAITYPKNFLVPTTTSEIDITVNSAREYGFIATLGDRTDDERLVEKNQELTINLDYFISTNSIPDFSLQVLKKNGTSLTAYINPENSFNSAMADCLNSIDLDTKTCTFIVPNDALSNTAYRLIFTMSVDDKTLSYIINIIIN